MTGYRVAVRLTSLAFVCLGVVSVWGASVESTAPAPDYARQAAAYERAGDRLKAAEAYEKLAVQDPAKRELLAGRLVRLYAETGQTNRALSWARVVMTTNPDPQAYLAGVNSMLGRHAEARAILAAEIQKAPEARRRMLLEWQLADVLNKAGQPGEAAEALGRALAAARGTPDEAAARRRVEVHGKAAEGGR